MEDSRLIISAILFVWAIICLLYFIYIDNRRRKYQREIQTYGLENPEEIPSEEEVAVQFKKLNNAIVKPYWILLIFILIFVLLTILFILVE